MTTSQRVLPCQSAARKLRADNRVVPTVIEARSEVERSPEEVAREQAMHEVERRSSTSSRRSSVQTAAAGRFPRTVQSATSGRQGHDACSDESSDPAGSVIAPYL
jgi:hypothetical protein